MQDSAKESIIKAQKHIENGENNQAIYLLQSVIDHEDVSAEALEMLAFVFAEEDNTGLAADYFSELASKGSEYHHYFLYAAQNWERSNVLEEAVICYRKYLKEEDAVFSAWFSLGKVHESLQELNMALEAYHKSFELRSLGHIAFRLGILYEKLNNNAQAENWLKKAIDAGNNEEKGKALLRLLSLSVRQKQFLRAEEFVIQIEKEYPDAAKDKVFITLRDQIRFWRKKQDSLEKELQALQKITKEFKDTSNITK